MDGSVAKIEPEIRPKARRIFDAGENTEILLGQNVVFIVVILNAKPFQHFRWKVGVVASGEEPIHFAGGHLAIVQIITSENNPERRQIVILASIQSPRGIKKSDGTLIIFAVERSFPDVIAGLRRCTTLRVFLK